MSGDKRQEIRNKSKESVTSAFNEWRLYSSITWYQTKIRLYFLINKHDFNSCLFVCVDSCIWKFVIKTNYKNNDV